MSKIRLYGATSGYVDLAAPAVADDATLTLPTAANGFGKALQVVSTTKTDTFSEAIASAGGKSAVVTGLTASITPSSTTNKVLVKVTLGTVGNSSASAGRGVGLIVMRDTTEVGIGDAAGSRTQVSAIQTVEATGDHAALSFTLLDSPATTSAVVYGIKLFNNSGVGATLYLNRTSSDSNVAGVGRTASTITVMEIGA